MTQATTAVQTTRPRVVVTGIGLVTPLGVGPDAFWQAASHGVSGLRPVGSMETEGYGSQLGGEVPREAVDWPETGSYTDDRTMVLALAAAQGCMEDGDAASRGVDPNRFGVVLGTCMGGMRSGEEWHRQLMTKGQASTDHQLLLAYQFDAATNAISAAVDARGPKATISTACAAGANAIGMAADAIRAGRADLMLAGGAEALAHIAYAGFSSLQSLSPEPCAPYSAGRTGLTLGEGAGLVLLETLEAAQARGAHIYAEVLGYGLSIDGYHPTAPHPEGRGAAQAITTALRNSGLTVDHIGYVNGHGTGTPKNDSAETKAIHAAFGDRASALTVSSTKSMVGHSLGAAGAIEGITTILALDHQFLPPTIGWRGPDPELDLDYLPLSGREAEVDAALSNSFAFGGNNAAVIYGRANAALPQQDPADQVESVPTGSTRVVITGTGAISAAGTGAQHVWDAVKGGTPLPTTVQAPEFSTLAAKVPEVDLDGFLTRRQTRRMDTSSIWAVVTSMMALRDAGLEPTDENRARIGVITGVGSGPADAATSFHGPLVESGPSAANPAVFPNTVFNAAAGQVAIHLGLNGPTSTVTGERASSATALAYAADLIAAGQADALLVVGIDECDEVSLAGYHGLRAAGRHPVPFGRDRDGFAPTGGSVAILLESEQHARRRGAQVLAELSGSCLTSGAVENGAFERSGDAVARAIAGAVEESGLEAGDVNAVVASASGSVVGDLSEARGIRGSLGTQVPVVAYKGVTGEPWGCTGAFGTLVAIGMITDSVLPATSGLSDVGAGCDLQHVTSPQTGQRLEHVLVNSVAGGGTNAALVISRYDDKDGQSA